MTTHRVVSLPDQGWIDAVDAAAGGIRLVAWDMTGPPPEPQIEVVVPPYQCGADRYERLRELPSLCLVQLLMAGYDEVLPLLPAGVSLANAAGVHNTSTSELTVCLTIASLRGLPEHVRHQQVGSWSPRRATSLADRRVLLIGYGGLGKAIASRLAPFECSITPVASSARNGVTSIERVAEVLPEHDVVILALPLTERTRGMVGAAFLAAMPDGALLVNVARGAVVDTAALLAELKSRRLLAAADVTDPEPLPSDHPLWSEPGFLLSPHVGGASTAFRPRAERLVRELLLDLSAGRPAQHVVVPRSG